jgi:hypothetical protein
MKTIKILGAWKGRIGYLSGVLTTIASLFIITSTLQDKAALLGFEIHYGLLLFICTAIAFITSYLLDKSGLMEAEVDYQNGKNQILKKMDEKVK